MISATYLKNLGLPVDAARADHLDAFLDQSLGYLPLRCAVALAITAIMIFSGMATAGIVWGLLVASAEFLWTTRSRAVRARRQPMVRVEYLTVVFINLVLVVIYMALAITLASNQTPLMLTAAVMWVAGGFFAAILVLVPDRLLMATTYGPAVVAMVLVAGLIEWSVGDGYVGYASALTLAMSVFFGIFIVRAFTMAVEFQRRAYLDRQALEMRRIAAERASVNKTAFLARMSHEIRTPLNGVLGCASLLSETQLTEQQRKLAQQISQSGDLLLSVMNDVLDISKIEIGGLELNTGPLNVERLFEDSITAMLPEAGQKSILLNSQLDQRLPREVIADGPRMRQLVLNLVTNALKFSGVAEVKMGFWHGGMTADGKINFTIEVFESGSGTYPMVRQGPEYPFGALHGDRSQFERSAGLGLIIARDLAEQMDGEMALCEGPSNGNRLCVKIPVPAATDSPTIGQRWRSDLEGRQLVIIDTSDLFGDRLCISLAAAGLEATFVPDIPAARAYCADKTDIDFVWVSQWSDKADWLDELTDLRTVPALRNTMLLLDAIRSPGAPAPDEKPQFNDASVYSVFDAVVERGPVPRSFPSLLSELHKKKVSNNLPKRVRGNIPNLRGRRIILAEDDTTNQMLLRALLEPTGAEIELAVDGLEAIGIVQERPADLILMDIKMPRMDGLEATRQIRDSSNGERPVRIIAVTANARQEDRSFFLEAGMDDYLSKPLLVDDVYDLLRQHLPESTK